MAVSFWAFAQTNPFWGAVVMCWLALFAYSLMFLLIRTVGISYRRTLRHRAIMKHGWPTAPFMDADLFLASGQSIEGL